MADFVRQHPECIWNIFWRWANSGFEEVREADSKASLWSLPLFKSVEIKTLNWV